MVGMTLPLSPRNECWDLVWHSSISPKISHFLLKFVYMILPTKLVLCNRHVITNPMCPFCSSFAETNFHVFFGFQFVQGMWRHILSRQIIDAIQGMEPAYMILELHRRTSKEEFELGYLQMWQLWYRRNLYVHQSKSFFDIYHQQRVTSTRDEFHMVNASQSRPVQSLPSIRHWQPPSHAQIKLNTDAACRADGAVQVGVAARDSGGTFIFSAAKKYNCSWPAPIAEAIGILFCLSVAHEFNIILHWGWEWLSPGY